MKKPLFVVKLGGEVLDDPQWYALSLQQLQACEHRLLVVHGGGKIASEMGKRLGLEPQYHQGRRITDAATLELVTMVYGGLLNKQLTAALSAGGKKALGVCGADAGLLPAQKRAVGEVDFGWVGDLLPDKLPADRWVELLESGFTPVVAPLSADVSGQLLNTNADTLAAQLAIALQSQYDVRLLYAFTLPGLLRNIQDAGSLIEQLDAAQAAQLKNEGVFQGGVLPKVDNALLAAEKGVQTVTICHANALSAHFAGQGPGTRIVASQQPNDFTADTPLDLLCSLLRIPAFSGEEAAKADWLQSWLAAKGVAVNRMGNNLWCVNKHFDIEKPTILLNSHLDTVKPNPQYSRHPWSPELVDGKLYGLGSNDAGGALVSLLFTFLAYEAAPNLAYNLCFLASAEEENSGSGGVELVWSHLPAIDFAMVGEPTSGELAVAEKGLLVVDAVVHGRAGHAAREEGDNALYKALADLEWVRHFRFERVSDTLGPVKMTATIIAAGSQHNVVPGTCRYTLDIRLNDCYTHEEVLHILRQHLQAELQPRSCRLRPSFLPQGHPLRLQAEKLGMHCYGSPTTSDQALMPVPSAKLGPGDSARSHTADEFIYVEQLQAGVDLYRRLLQPLLMP